MIEFGFSLNEHTKSIFHSFVYLLLTFFSFICKMTYDKSLTCFTTLATTPHTTHNRSKPHTTQTHISIHTPTERPYATVYATESSVSKWETERDRACASVSVGHCVPLCLCLCLSVCCMSWDSVFDHVWRRYEHIKQTKSSMRMCASLHTSAIIWKSFDTFTVFVCLKTVLRTAL